MIAIAERFNISITEEGIKKLNRPVTPGKPYRVLMAQEYHDETYLAFADDVSEISWIECRYAKVFNIINPSGQSV